MMPIPSYTAFPTREKVSLNIKHMQLLGPGKNPAVLTPPFIFVSLPGRSKEEYVWQVNWPHLEPCHSTTKPNTFGE